MQQYGSCVKQFDTVIVERSGIQLAWYVCWQSPMAWVQRCVLLLEGARNGAPDGCIFITEALTLPGYLHDKALSQAPHPPVRGQAGVCGELGAELACGFGLWQNDTPTGVLLPDGRHLVLEHVRRSRAANMARFDARWPGRGGINVSECASTTRGAERQSAIAFTLLGDEVVEHNRSAKRSPNTWKKGLHPPRRFWPIWSLPKCARVAGTEVQSTIYCALLGTLGVALLRSLTPKSAVGVDAFKGGGGLHAGGRPSACRWSGGGTRTVRGTGN
jgi:hypothetical protein